MVKAEMVKEIKKLNKKQEIRKYYQCEECELIYKDKKWAEKCEAWCKKNKSCNVGIAKFRVLSEI